MSKYQLISNAFHDLRSCDDVCDKLLTDGVRVLRTDGEWAMFTDLGVPEDLINVLKTSDVFQNFKYVTSPEREEHETFNSDNSRSVNEIGSCLEELNSICKEIRECCDVYGRETYRHLSRTAECILKLGSIYIRVATSDETSIIWIVS